MQSAVRLLLSVLLALQLAAGAKYGCVFDCYLLGGSAQGFIEYSCDNYTKGNAGCCNWKECIGPTAAAYRGKICPPGEIAQPNPPSGGFAKYSVSSDGTAAALFPRQTSPLFQVSGEEWGDCSAEPASNTVGCTGNCIGHSVRVEISQARAQ